MQVTHGSTGPPLTGLELVSHAMKVAMVAHDGQHRTDPQTGRHTEPYFFHPVRVASAVSSYEAKAAALLHDVLEDTDWTLSDLKTQGFPEVVLEAVEALTRRKPPKHPEKEVFMAYVRRLSSNPIAREIKLADMADNSSDQAPDAGVLKRYARARKILEAAS